MMTFVVDLSAIVMGREGAPGRTNLLDRSCRPVDSDDSRALFSFPINHCGSQAKVVLVPFLCIWLNGLTPFPTLFQVEKGLVKYENQVSLSTSLDNEGNRTDSGSKAQRYI